MDFKKTLSALVGAGMIGVAAPMETRAESSEPAPEAAKVQEVKTSWVQSIGNWTWGALGKGLDYVGQGATYTGQGIGWGFSKTMFPVRWLGDKAKAGGDFLARGPEWVEDKTGIPMQTAAGVLRAPGNFVFSITDNTADLLTEAPTASLGMVGSTVSMLGKTVEGDLSGAGNAGKELGKQSWDFVKTGVGDGGVLALQGVGLAAGGAGLVPVFDITRDGVVAVRRSVDLATGEANLDERISKDLIGAIMNKREPVNPPKNVAQKTSETPSPAPVKIQSKGASDQTSRYAQELRNRRQNG